MDERVEWALTQGGAVGRGQGQAEAERHWPVGRAAAAAVHRARRSRSSPRCCCWTSRARRSTRSRPRKIEELIDELKTRLHGRDRHPQHAAGGARVGLHRLHVPGRPDRVRRDRHDLHQAEAARKPRTTSPAGSAERVTLPMNGKRSKMLSSRSFDRKFDDRAGGDPQRACCRWAGWSSRRSRARA